MRRGRGMRRGRRRLGPLLLGEVEDVHVIIVAGEALGRRASPACEDELPPRDAHLRGG
jgi:hypothetical protein